MAHCGTTTPTTRSLGFGANRDLRLTAVSSRVACCCLPGALLVTKRPMRSRNLRCNGRGRNLPTGLGQETTTRHETHDRTHEQVSCGLLASGLTVLVRRLPSRAINRSCSPSSTFAHRLFLVDGQVPKAGQRGQTTERRAVPSVGLQVSR